MSLQKYFSDKERQIARCQYSKKHYYSHKSKAQQYYQDHKIEFKERNRKWRKQNPGISNEYSKRGWQKMKDEKGINYYTQYKRTIAKHMSTRKREQSKIWLNEYKRSIGGCQICGYSRCPASLDFHHRDPTQKEYRISELMTWGVNKMKQELTKCICLCKNCHAELHYLERNNLNKQDEVKNDTYI